MLFDVEENLVETQTTYEGGQIFRRPTLTKSVNEDKNPFIHGGLLNEADTLVDQDILVTNEDDLELPSEDPVDIQALKAEAEMVDTRERLRKSFADNKMYQPLL